jgi:hypothetical protein
MLIVFTSFDLVRPIDHSQDQTAMSFVESTIPGMLLMLVVHFLIVSPAGFQSPRDEPARGAIHQLCRPQD